MESDYEVFVRVSELFCTFGEKYNTACYNAEV